MNDLHGTTFIFPPFRMDPNQRVLCCEDRGVSLTPKEFDTLLALVEAAGNVVDKETLIARVWPDSYVGDGSLARNISVLRKALGGGVIETVPRRGYRLTVPVTSAVPSGPAAPEPVETLEAANQKKRDTSAADGFRFRLGLTIAAAVLFATFLLAFHFSAVSRAGSRSPSGASEAIHSVVIEKIGGVDPLDEGFKMYADGGHDQSSLRSRDNQGFDRLKLTANAQFLFYRSLTDVEKDFALARDWKLTCVCALDSGMAFAFIDFGRYKDVMRFDIVLLREGSKYFVALTKQLSPEFEWEEKVEFPGVADVDNPHTYELRYDHLSRTASLWIDGKQMASGYRGHRQFRENTGLDFGCNRYLSGAESVGIFRTVRFEAN